MGMKEKWFMKEVRDSLIEWNNIRAKQLANLLNLAVVVGIPGNDDEVAKLQMVCKTCDDLMAELLSEMEDIKARVDRGTGLYT